MRAVVVGMLLAGVAGSLRAQDPYTNLPRVFLSPNQLPLPYASASASTVPRVVPARDASVLQVPVGFSLLEAAEDFRMPRAMVLAPNGDVFLSEPAAHRVTVLRDADHDGKFEGRWVFADGLDLPFGLAFIGDWLYVANTANVVRFPYREGDTKATRAAEVVVPRLPGRGYNQHWTRNLLYDAKTKSLFISVGSQSNASEEEPHRAAILRCDPDGKNLEVFASGLRNPVGLALEPLTGALWTAVNERDGLGDELVPDFATRVVPGGFYGWPYSFIGQHPHPGLAQKRPDLVAKAIVPDVLFPSHSASLGIAFYTGTSFPEHFRGGAFVAFHGSWNRSAPTGFKVVYLPFQKGRALGYCEDFLTGFLVSREEVSGRPVCVLVDRDGSLLISDDGGNRIWRVRFRAGGA